MKYFSHLNTAVTILQEYQGQQPFDGFIKQFFSQHKKYGSKDRKNISQLCYAYFRLGKALPELSIEERVLTGLFLCSTSPNELLENLKPEWNIIAGKGLRQKLGFDIRNIFPWKSELSIGIDYESFCASFLTQPDLFIRLRPKKEAIVKLKLNKAGLQFRELSGNCLALDNASKVDQIININEEAVIQDYNSQRVGELLVKDQKLSLWDCCAGSGGKSLMAYDLIPDLDLAVSDIRSSILSNLKKRFTEAGIKNYQSFVIDLSSNNSLLTPHLSLYSFIIADVSCTGSGTWSRTPEQLYFFDPTAIEKYSSLQKKIVQHVIPALKPGGYFLYITCSVFKQENEEVVDFIGSQCGLTLQKMELLKGYDMRADSMFAALFIL